MGFLSQIVGAKGCDDQVGAGTYTAPGNHKIAAIGIVADAEVTNFKWDNRFGVEQVETSKEWIGVTLSAAAGANAYIPLGRDAKSVEVASGTVRMFFK